LATDILFIGAHLVCSLVQSMAGPTPGLVYALIFPDGAAFGSFIDAIQTPRKTDRYDKIVL